MSPSIPRTMRALVTAEGHTAVVKEIPTPTADYGEILVKVVAAAQNPADWKHVGWSTQPDLIVGCDFAGDVVEVAEGAEGFRVGDRVAGFVYGSQYKDRGAFAEYVKNDCALSWHVPDGVSYEEAATMSVGFFTAAQTMFHPKNLGLVGYPDKWTGSSDPEGNAAAPWVLVFSGATSVGMYAIQLAHLAGYRVVTTASPKNVELVKALGADVVVDYRDPEVSRKVREATNGELHLGLDTFASAETQEASVRAFGPGRGKLIAILPVQESARAIREDVEIKGTMLYTASRLPQSGPTSMGGQLPAASEDHRQVADWMPKITELLQKGLVKPNPVKLWPGGLDAVVEGFEYMKSGRLSAEKIVYRV
ncbi:zinc-binding oxidoreductase ToxD [Punctularia strigosozonata HHB-11173 SS5]|uniref:zinc-binding oxidoreductase ToxD n=1 Tax=Punctularia strigosozonata (strain HHB-11173) TaxID=741275 RepID=UPI00044177CE|nr:zinc-binding oxidoreductase ToxD [Punctularia strigosozonata HHB-11173 SS5]EIN07436.1 zinc-binding oxidoreductase ToxD [Punctularia strigosozonata HHB-11173 SS5]